ncbi:hypothetical protein [Variovorax terrae]|uniref:Uncharacterized protein n=1 Tax=Variovorax terrae TaxID=2923278 RepID=A0A9X1VTA9_9BURK|nr:hypothetical protein [Variovorax terrae]MCJ0762970.1 hypothetical protein [Variovorax terrae]
MTQPPGKVGLLLQRLAEFPGLDACALVDADTGMTWHHAGRLHDMDRIGEVAVEFWRVHGRLAMHFKDFGGLNSAAYAFAHRVVALFPCSEAPPLVLVCVAQKKNVAWSEWAPHVLALRQALAAAPLP